MSEHFDNDKRNDLLERAKNGDQEAFWELVVDYEQMMRSIVRSFIRNIRDYEEKDIVNEVILRTYKTIPEFRGNEIVFKSFLRRTARGLCLNIIKKQGKDRQEREEVKEHTHSAPMRPDEIYSEEEIRKCVQKAIGLLPEKLRKVVILKDIDGFKYEKIAENLSVPVGTVQSRINRGREQLKKLLKNLRCVEML